MQVASLQQSATGTVPHTAGPQMQKGPELSSLLAKGHEQHARHLGRDEKLRQAADQLVSSALIKPLLQQARQSPFRVERFHGGQGEKAFMSQLHTVLADRISKSANFNVADAIYDKMTKQYEGRVQTNEPTGGEVNTRG